MEDAPPGEESSKEEIVVQESTSSPARSPSPVAEEESRDPKFIEEVNRLSEVLNSISPAAARTAIRQNWRKSLVGSSRDESFFLRALTQRTSDHVLTRLLEEEEERILQVADEHCKSFLDKAMQLRLGSIGARELVAQLAQAQRLGYGEADAVEQDETVLPVMSARPEDAGDDTEDADEPLQVERPPPPNFNTGTHMWRLPTHVPANAPYNNGFHPGFSDQQQRWQNDVHRLKEEHERSGSKRKMCERCGQTFLQAAGLKYHHEKQVCMRQKAPQVYKFFCPLCNKGFTTNGGLGYHKINNVCQGGTILPNQDQMAIPATTPDDHSSNGIAAPQALPEQQMRSEFQQPTATPPIPAPPAPGGVAPVSSMSTPHRGMSIHTTDSRQGTPLSAVPLPASLPKQVISTIELTPEKRAELEEKLAQEQLRYEGEIRNLDPTLDPAERDIQEKKIRQGSSTRKSIIRRQYGITLRNRSSGTPNRTPLAVVAAPTPSPPRAPATQPHHEMTSTPPVSRPSALQQGTAVVELTPEQIDSMNAELAKEERRLEHDLSNIPDSLQGFEREAERKRLKAGAATRKSIVRRKYGVQIRRSKVAAVTVVRTPDSRTVPIKGSRVSVADLDNASSSSSAHKHSLSSTHTPDYDISKRRRTTSNLPASHEPKYSLKSELEADRRASVGPSRMSEFHSHSIPRQERSDEHHENRNNGIPGSFNGTFPPIPQRPGGGFVSVNMRAPPQPAYRSSPYGSNSPYAAPFPAPDHLPSNGHAQTDAPKPKKLPINEAQRIWESQHGGRKENLSPAAATHEAHLKERYKEQTDQVGWQIINGAMPAPYQTPYAQTNQDNEQRVGGDRGQAAVAEKRRSGVVDLLNHDRSADPEFQSMAQQQPALPLPEARAREESPASLPGGPGAGGVPTRIIRAAGTPPVEKGLRARKPSTVTQRPHKTSTPARAVPVDKDDDEDSSSSDMDSDTSIPARKPTGVRVTRGLGRR
jgi:hypothetical protein